VHESTLSATRHKISNDLDRDPVVVFWEVTRACALACSHCRAMAKPERDPRELTTEEGFRLFDDLTSFDHTPIVVLSGGDPFMRRDIFELVAYGLSKGLLVSVSPSATKLATQQRLRRLKELGVSSVSLSLDGASDHTHDAFRGVSGSFQRTLETIDRAVDVGLSIQVNTTVARKTLPELRAIASLLFETGIVRWDVFFLVPTGRAMVEEVISPTQHEETFDWLCDLAEEAPFSVKTTLGQPYRRVQAQRKLAQLGYDSKSPTPQQLAEVWNGIPSNDAKGILFVSHVGDVYPSGFLPISVGNVRNKSVVALYRQASLFRQLRNSANLKGKCGRCPFNTICGGCRARAYAFTGDPLEADPICTFKRPERPAPGQPLPR